jgi:predicted Zn-dependent protease
MLTDALRAEVERELVVEKTGWAAERAARVSERLQAGVAPSERLDTLVVWWSEHNAFTCFGRTIYISRRLFERLPDDDAAAFIVAHEIAHHRLGHIPRFVASRLLPARLILAALERLLCSPRREADADRLAIELSLAAGYDLERCLVALDILALVSLDYGDVDGVYGGDERRSHPALNDRIVTVRAHAAGVRAGARLDVQRSIAEERRRRRARLVQVAAGLAVAGCALLVLRRVPKLTAS